MISRQKLSKVFNSSGFYVSLVALAMAGAAILANYTIGDSAPNNSQETNSSQKFSPPSR